MERKYKFCADFSKRDNRIVGTLIGLAKELEKESKTYISEL